MNNDLEKPLAQTQNKNFYLDNEPKKKHPLLQLFIKSILNNKDPIIEDDQSKRKSSFAISQPKIIANLGNNTNINNNILDYNNKNNNIFTTPKNSFRRVNKLNTNLTIGKKMLFGSSFKKKNSINTSRFEPIKENNDLTKQQDDQKCNTERISDNIHSYKNSSPNFTKRIFDPTNNNSIINNLMQSTNKSSKPYKKVSFINFDNNNSVFISQPQPIKIKNFFRFGADKGIVQKTVSLDVLATPRICSPKKKDSNLSPFFIKKISNSNVNFKRKNADKKQTCLFPSVNIFNINAQKIENNKTFNKKENGEDDNSNSIKNIAQNFQKDNNNFYKSLTNNNVTSVCKPPIINDNKNKVEYNNFTSLNNNNLYSINSYNYKNNDKINETQRSHKKRLGTVIPNSENQKIKFRKRLSVDKFEIRKELLEKQEKIRSYKKKVTTCLKDNLRLFNKIIFDKKVEDENKNKSKDKIALFRSNKFVKKPTLNQEIEKIKESENENESENNNNENNQNENKEINNNNKNNGIAIENSKASSQKESSSLSNSVDVTDNISSPKINIKYNKKTTKKINFIEENINVKIENSHDNSSVDKSGGHNSDLPSLRFDSDETENNENSSPKDEYVSESKKKARIMRDIYFKKYSDEKSFNKKKRTKITSKLQKINEESYVYNTCKKEIINNFIQNSVIENMTKKIINTFGLMFLDEEEAEKHIQQKFLIYDKDVAFKEALDESTNNPYLEQMKRNFKIIYTKKITIKYNFNVVHVQDSLNIYEDYLLHLIDNSWNKINSKYEYSLEMIKYITNNKTMTNYKSKTPDQLRVKNNNNMIDKNDQLLNKKIIRRNQKILKTDRNFFKYLGGIQRELHLKTAYLYLRLNLLDFGLHESNTLAKFLDSNNKKLKRRTKKNADFSTVTKPKKSYILKTFKYSNSIANFSKRQSVFSPKMKSFFNFNPENTNKKENKETELTKIKEITLKNSLFISTKKIKKKRRSTIAFEALLPGSKKIKELEAEEEFKKDVEQKEKNLNDTENNLSALNLLKNKYMFKKRYNEDMLDVEKKITAVCRNLQNSWDITQKLKSENFIIKSSGYDPLTREAVSIKTQEIEKDLPEFKLFEKFVLMLQSRKFNLFRKCVEIEGDKFLKIINKQDISSGNTLLHFAVQNKIVNIIETLLMKGADPNIQNSFGNTPLHLAYRYSSSLMINLLLQYNADKKINNFDGFLPWQMSKYDTD